MRKDSVFLLTRVDCIAQHHEEVIGIFSTLDMVNTYLDSLEDQHQRSFYRTSEWILNYRIKGDD